MVSKAEQQASRYLRLVTAKLTDGETIEESAEFRELQGALELFLPSVLSETYPAQWRYESFDAFRFAVASKTGPAEANLLGLGLLISDQTWTPVHARLRASTEADAISWVLCRVGSRIGEGPEMVRHAYDSTRVSKLLFSVSECPEKVAWAFTSER